MSSMNQACASYTTSTTCTSKPAELCAWDASTSSCSIGNGIIDQQWLRGKVYCPGSLADYAVTCSALTSQSSCNGNSNCVWQSTTPASSFTSQFLSTVTAWTGASVAVAAGVCAPKWSTDTTAVAGLLSKIFGSLNVTSVSIGDGFASTVGPIFGDMFGTCSGVTQYKNLVFSCGLHANKTTCDAVMGCVWTPSGTGNITTNGECAIGSDFSTSLFLNVTDPWVVAVNSATSACAAQLSSTACSGLASINVDTSKYTTTFAAIPLSFPTFSLTGAAGVAGVPSLLLSLVAGLACMWALLL